MKILNIRTYDDGIKVRVFTEKKGEHEIAEAVANAQKGA